MIAYTTRNLTDEPTDWDSVIYGRWQYNKGRYRRLVSDRHHVVALDQIYRGEVARIVLRSLRSGYAINAIKPVLRQLGAY